jgi:L-ascorbate metabolism protein UlaG (beta-lactamase superfamily)
MRSSEGTAYHAGDTGYFDHFKKIGKLARGIDWAMLPIGAYDPAWLLSEQHISPEQAGRAFLELDATNIIGMHWGTFKLSDEPPNLFLETIQLEGAAALRPGAESARRGGELADGSAVSSGCRRADPDVP